MKIDCEFVFKLQVKYIFTVGANALVDLNPTKYNIKWMFAQLTYPTHS